MRHERGIGLIAVLFWMAVSAGLYVGSFMVPFYIEDYIIKTEAQGPANDFLARIAKNATEVEDGVVKVFSRHGIERDDFEVTVTTDPGEEWVEIAVAYDRKWRPVWEKKDRLVHFEWTRRESRK